MKKALVALIIVSLVGGISYWQWYKAKHPEDFQKKAAPKLLSMSVQQQVNEEEGAKLIEEYKQKRLALQ
ncbi:MAG TPA: hypothetical protein PLS56_01330 [Candidatus Dojkabacteria bacterium]|nr:hypothetical protein [Candidatus Dojkabacteria bacterium]